MTKFEVKVTNGMAYGQSGADFPSAFTHPGESSSLSPGFHTAGFNSFPRWLYPIARKRSLGPTGTDLPDLRVLVWVGNVRAADRRGCFAAVLPFSFHLR